MERGKKNRTQGTGKEENRVDNIRPDSGAASQTDDMANAGVAPQMQGKDLNAGNRITEDKPVGSANENSGKTGAFTNNNSSNDYQHEVDVNTGGVPLEKSPGATNLGNNPSNTDLGAAPGARAGSNDLADDRQAVARSVDDDAEKQTGRPTGAIYGSDGDIISVKNDFDKGNDAKGANQENQQE